MRTEYLSDEIVGRAVEVRKTSDEQFPEVCIPEISMPGYNNVRQRRSLLLGDVNTWSTTR